MPVGAKMSVVSEVRHRMLIMLVVMVPQGTTASVRASTRR
jgi:hypothetical protein